MSVETVVNTESVRGKLMKTATMFNISWKSASVARCKADGSSCPKQLGTLSCLVWSSPRLRVLCWWISFFLIQNMWCDLTKTELWQPLLCKHNRRLSCDSIGQEGEKDFFNSRCFLSTSGQWLYFHIVSGLPHMFSSVLTQISEHHFWCHKLILEGKSFVA